MPNWVRNILVLSGPIIDREQFINGAIKRSTMTHVEFEICETYLPLPGKEWQYDEAIDLWGSKWGDCNTTVACHGLEFTNLRFDTAWDTFGTAARRLSGIFPTLTFGLAYMEEQPAFAGCTVFRNGKPVHLYVVDLSDFPPYEESTETLDAWLDEKWDDMLDFLKEVMWADRQPNLMGELAWEDSFKRGGTVAHQP